MLYEAENLASLETLESRLLMNADAVPSVGSGPIGLDDTNEVYYVSPTGSPTNDGTLYSPWNTVEYALSRVGGGHTIILEPGTYAPFSIWPSQSGTADHPTIIRSQYKWQAIVTSNGEARHNIYVSDGGSWVVIDGIQSVNSAIDGIKVLSNNSTVENCWVHDSTSQGISMHTVTNGVIENNLIEDNGVSGTYDHGVYASGNNLLVEGNILRKNSGCGLQLASNLTNSTVTNNLVYDNKIGLLVATTATDGENLIENNTLLNNTISFYECGDAIGIFTGNTIKGNYDTGNLGKINSNSVSDYTSLLEIQNTQSGDVPTATLDSVSTLRDERLVWVWYRDSGAVDISRLSSGNLTVTGPNGYVMQTDLLHVLYVYDTGKVLAAYRVPAPTGGWSYASNGTYQVSLNAQVLYDMDSPAHATPAQNLGTFTVNIPATDTTPPSAEIKMDTVVAGAKTLGIITYFRDDIKLSGSSAAACRIIVTGPNGFSQTVAGNLASNTANSDTITAQYYISSGKVWTAANNGRYTVQLATELVDAAGNVLPAGTIIGTFDLSFPAPETTPPTITITNTGTSAFGVATRDFVVTYHDDSGVKTGTIDCNDLTITGPNGFSQQAQIVTTSVSADGATVTATYRMTAPGGMWDAGDNGNYQVSLAAGAVSDIYDNLTIGATLTQFTVSVLNAVPVLQSYGSAQAGSAYLSLTIKSTLAPIPMIVKGPGGFSAQVEILNTVAGANGGYVSTCRVLAPGGTWDYADNGTYTVTPKSTVGLAAGNVGTFIVNLAKPAPAPTGTLLGISTTPAGNTYVEVTLSYYNGTAITPSSFTPDQIQLRGPNGYVMTGQIYSKGNLDSKHVSVTYRFTAPGGKWDYTDNGTYSLYKIAATGNTATVFSKFTVKLAIPKTTLRTAVTAQDETPGVVSGPWQQTPVNILADIMPMRLRVA